MCVCVGGGVILYTDSTIGCYLLTTLWIRQNFILKQIDNPNRLCDTINLRVKLRFVDKPEGKVSVGGQIITNLRYTNDTTLVERTSEDLLELMKRVKAVSEQVKPYLKVEKTTIMIWRSSWSSGVVNQWLSRMVKGLLISGDDWLRLRPKHLLQHFQISVKIETSPEHNKDTCHKGVGIPNCNTMNVSHRQTGEQYQPLRCGAEESCLGYHREIQSPMNTYSPSLTNTHH